jgi:IMP dehydrogenase/GMP reductase
MIEEKKLYSLKDVCIIPTPTTMIESKSECDCRVSSLTGGIKRYLPLVTAPMSCVLYENNYKFFVENKISVVIPRTVPFETRLELMHDYFCAFGIDECEEILKNYSYVDSANICIDVANGHMSKQLILGAELKKRLQGRIPECIKIMGGNIANPETYEEYDNVGFDYVRVGIGSGNGCLSSTQLGVHYPMASLLDEINNLRKYYRMSKKTKDKGRCKVIADGGMTGYSDIIKAIALGADYVMCGMLFSKAATGEEKIGDNIEYYGMSTKRAQQEMGKTTLKTSEGKFLNLTKEYTLSGWVENFDSYLRSAMSYCNARTLGEFRERTKLQVISNEMIRIINDK